MNANDDLGRVLAGVLLRLHREAGAAAARTGHDPADDGCTEASALSRSADAQRPRPRIYKPAGQTHTATPLAISNTA